MASRDLEHGINVSQPQTETYPQEKTSASQFESDSIEKPGYESPAYDAEKNAAIREVGSQEYVGSNEETEQPGRVKRYLRMLKPFIWPVVWLLFTGWWIAGLVLHRYDLGWLIPFLLWLGITIRIFTFYVSTKYVTKPIRMIWMNTIHRGYEMIPSKFRTPLGAAGTVAVILIGTFATEESADNTRANRAVSLFGLLVFIFCFWLTSNNRKLINWTTVCVGMLAQFLLALFVLRSQAGYDIFNFIAFLAKELLGMASAGVIFLFDVDMLSSGYFVINVLPAIIFFVAIVQLLYYWGWLQFFVGKFATVFFHCMQVSGAEAVVAAASPFVGQGESAMLIKPFIQHLTNAELHSIMCSGFATIAGSVLAFYIGLGLSPVALVSSCVMSIPASLAISKLRYPETEESLTAGKVTIPEGDEERPSNSLHALANGGLLGIKIAGTIAASLLVVLSTLALVNALLTWWGHYLNINSPDLTIELIVGYLFYPVAWLLGVKNEDVYHVAQLIGIKVMANEFVAFTALTKDVAYAALSPRSRLIATYACCGFGNISSVGIQIGVLSALAPGRSGRVAKVAVSALLSGIIATLTSASIAGMLITDAQNYTVASTAA